MLAKTTGFIYRDRNLAKSTTTTGEITMSTEADNKELSRLVNQRQAAELEVRKAEQAIKKIQAQSGQ